MDHTLLQIVLYLHHRLERAQRSETMPLSLSQYRMLFLIQQGPARSVELATASGLTKPSVATLVSQLEAQGLIRRKELKSDKRAASLSITASGRKAVQAFERALNQELESFLGAEVVDRAESELLWLLDAVQAGRDKAHVEWRLRIRTPEDSVARR